MFGTLTSGYIPADLVACLVACLCECRPQAAPQALIGAECWSTPGRKNNVFTGSH